jgi:hypothetical protein
MATTLMLLNAKIATYVGAIQWRWNPVTLVNFVSGDIDGESWYYNGVSPITANITIDLDGQVISQSSPGTFPFELRRNGVTIGSVSITTSSSLPYTFANKIIQVNNVVINPNDSFTVFYPVYDITSLRQITSSFQIYIDGPTPTPTQTPSTTPIICGEGVTTGIYYYTDCCGNFVQGTNTNVIVTMDYTKPNNGITKLNVIATTTCATPAATQTQTPTPTQTQTPTQTITPTQTLTLSPTNTPRPTSEPNYKLKNDCDVFTLFDMGVRCQVLREPSSNDSFDGILTIKVTGGTTPYSFYWDGGQRTQTLRNIPSGNYPITIVDYYGDYTANTICSIFAPSPTPTSTTTPTPTITPSPSWPSLCLIVTYATQSYGPSQFVISGSQNGKPQWTSGSMVLGWSITNLRWEIQGWTNTVGLPVSTDPSNIPTSSWAIAGGTGTQPSISMTQGTCPTYLPLSTNVVGTNTSCSGTENCNGSISITTMNGVAPYIYSIDNGVTFQSSNVFNGLCQNTYTVITKDSLNNTQTKIVVIGFDSAPITYSISTVVDRIQNIGDTTQIAYWHVKVNPPITDGSIVTFDLNVSTTKNYNGPGTGTISDTIIVSQNDVRQYPSTTSSLTTTSNRPYCSPNQTINLSESEVYQLQVSKDITVTGTSTSILQITDGQVGANRCVTKLDQTILTSVSTSVINGCTCCTITDDDEPQGIVNHSLQFGQITVTPPIPPTSEATIEFTVQKYNSDFTVYATVVEGLINTELGFRGNVTGYYTTDCQSKVDSAIFGPRILTTSTYTVFTEVNGNPHESWESAAITALQIENIEIYNPVQYITVGGHTYKIIRVGECFR